MANWRLNKLIKAHQLRFALLLGAGAILAIGVFVVFLSNAHPKKSKDLPKPVDITGIVEESFTKALDDNALVTQQTELESLKKQITELTNTINTMNEEHKKQLQTQKEELNSQIVTALEQQEKKNTNLPPEVQNQSLWHNPNTYAMNGNIQGLAQTRAPTGIHMVSFRRPRSRHSNYLNPAHYVPSNTSVRAVILGGADADASVNGQSKNNGVMLFKFIEDGTLPNGARSHLCGCRVSANTYGDISSERAFATLYHLSCAHPGQPIIDKEVTGWVFFNGKVGIKGVPLMRDGKVMTWAGAGSLLSSTSSVAQMTQSQTQASLFGPASYVVPSQAVPYVGLGATAKTGDYLAQYYIKRAEQYHPVIQVGSGNMVTVVFKDGFYLEPDEAQMQHAASAIKTKQQTNPLVASNEEGAADMNFTVPPEVLSKIDRANSLSRSNVGVTE